MNELIAVSAWVVGMIAWGVIRYPVQRRARKLKVARATGGTRDRIALWLAVVGQLIVPVAYLVSGFPAFADYGFFPLQAWLGIAVMIAALVLFRITHKQLGKNWSVTLETREKHALVTDGLYRFVRHPMYSSFFMLALAQLLLIQNWIAGPAGLVGVGCLFFLRVAREEELMIETFGEDYRRYMKTTARVIPGIY